MKKQFHQFYRPSADDLEQLWKTCLFAFDANVLLRLYHYSQATQDGFLNVLTSLGNRIWLPHQAGLEYHHRRCGVILQELAPYKDITGSLRRIEETLQKSPTEHPFVKPQTVSRFKRMAKDLLKELKEGQEAHQKLVTDDPILTKLTVLFNGRTGEPYSSEKLKQIEKDGEDRKNNKIPPALCDAAKERNKYGDLIIWMQLLDKAKADKQGIIFVTDDEKQDWWNKRIGGPRSELRAEMKAVADAACYLYTATDFVELAKGYLKQSVKDEVIREMKDAAEQRKREALAEWLENTDPATLLDLQSQAILMFHEFGIVMDGIYNWCDRRLGDTKADALVLPNLGVLGKHLDQVTKKWGPHLSEDLRKQLRQIAFRCVSIEALPPEDQVQQANGLKPVPREWVRNLANYLGIVEAC